MAVGALIGAYQEDDSGGLRALLPLAGRTLVEYQVRCAAAAGAAPIVILVERIPPALHEAFERLRTDGLADCRGQRRRRSGDPVRGRFVDPAGRRRHCADGRLVGAAGRRTRAGDRDRSGRRAAPGVRADRRVEPLGRSGRGRWPNARRDGGDAWRLGSAVDPAEARASGRRAASTGHAPRANRCSRKAPTSLRASSVGLIASSRGVRSDWASRYILPMVEEFATERLMDTQVRPQWLIWARSGADGGRRFRIHARLAVAGDGNAGRCQRRSTWSRAV